MLQTDKLNGLFQSVLGACLPGLRVCLLACIIPALPVTAPAQASIDLAGEMVSIPAGSFRMGDLSGVGPDWERPVHTVTVPAFRMGKYEVTVAQWDACVADGGCNELDKRYRAAGKQRGDACAADRGLNCHRGWEDLGWGHGDHPVNWVSWDEVQSFIDWLNNKTNGNYRLPTEAEWEYAARAGTTTEYSWGDDIGHNRANCDGCGSQWDNDRSNTAPVGSFPANPWGLHDMHGNVWEWVQDCGNDSYKGAPTDGSAWTGGDCGLRVRRSGTWVQSQRWLRSASRGWFDRAGRHIDVGFRLAQDE